MPIVWNPDRIPGCPLHISPHKIPNCWLFEMQVKLPIAHCPEIQIRFPIADCPETQIKFPNADCLKSRWNSQLPGNATQIPKCRLLEIQMKFPARLPVTVGGVYPDKILNCRLPRYPNKMSDCRKPPKSPKTVSTLWLLNVRLQCSSYLDYSSQTAGFGAKPPTRRECRAELLFLSFSLSKMRRFSILGQSGPLVFGRCSSLKNGLEGETPSKIQEPSASVLAPLL